MITKADKHYATLYLIYHGLAFKRGMGAKYRFDPLLIIARAYWDTLRCNR